MLHSFHFPETIQCNLTSMVEYFKVLSYMTAIVECGYSERLNPVINNVGVGGTWWSIFDMNSWIHCFPAECYLNHHNVLFSYIVSWCHSNNAHTSCHPLPAFTEPMKTVSVVDKIFITVIYMYQTKKKKSSFHFVTL